MTIILNDMPTKTLFFRFQRSFRRKYRGRRNYYLYEVWPLIYQELKCIHSVHPWAVSFYAGPCDYVVHGCFGLIFTIRFIINGRKTDLTVKLLNTHLISPLCIACSSHEFKSLDEWGLHIVSIPELKSLSRSIIFKKVLSYTI